MLKQSVKRVGNHVDTHPVLSNLAGHGLKVLLDVNETQQFELVVLVTLVLAPPRCCQVLLHDPVPEVDVPR